MQNTKLSNRYSKALLDLALENKCLDSVYSDMKSLVSMIDNNRDLQLLLKSPIVKVDKKVAIFTELFKSFNKLSIDFVVLIAGKRRETELHSIAKEFTRMYAAFNNIQQITITSSSPLNEELRTKLKEIVSNETNSKVEIIEKTNPSLLGGFVLRIGDNQIDTSISTQIRKVKQELLS